VRHRAAEKLLEPTDVLEHHRDPRLALDPKTGINDGHIRARQIADPTERQIAKAELLARGRRYNQRRTAQSVAVDRPDVLQHQLPRVIPPLNIEANDSKSCSLQTVRPPSATTAQIHR
jgi:hypothetical protein